MAASRSSSAAGVTAFLAWLETAAREESGLPLPAGPAVPGAVQLLTVHGSKGLEWDEVHLFGMAEGIFPTDQREHWLNSLGAQPWPLRGDRGHLPQWDTDQTGTTGLQESWTAFLEDNDERVVAEERRLAYVGITRARERLHLSRATVRSAWGAPQYNPASRFLDEIPAHLVTWERLAGASPMARGDRAPAVATLAHRPGVRSPGTREVIALAPGDRVTHDTFGLGSVVRVEGQGDKTVAHVDFGEETGTKRLLLRYAPLEKL